MDRWDSRRGANTCFHNPVRVSHLRKFICIPPFRGKESNHRSLGFQSISYFRIRLNNSFHFEDVMVSRDVNSGVTQRIQGDTKTRNRQKQLDKICGLTSGSQDTSNNTYCGLKYYWNNLPFLIQTPTHMKLCLATAIHNFIFVEFGTKHV